MAEGSPRLQHLARKRRPGHRDHVLPRSSNFPHLVCGRPRSPPRRSGGHSDVLFKTQSAHMALQRGAARLARSPQPSHGSKSLIVCQAEFGSSALSCRWRAQQRLGEGLAVRIGPRRLEGSRVEGPACGSQWPCPGPAPRPHALAGRRAAADRRRQ